MGGYGEVFKRNVLASGVIPQISVIMGPCAGGDVYSPAMTDFIFMVRDTSYMFVTGPDVVKTVTNEVVTAEELGGATVHTTKSASPTAPSRTTSSALLQMRRLIDFLPANNETACRNGRRTTPRPRRGVARHADPRQSEQALRHQGADPQSRGRGRLLRDQRGFAKNIVTGFGRIAGNTVGFVANQPMVLAGVLDSTPRARRRASCASATPSTFRSSPLSTCPASCPARPRI